MDLWKVAVAYFLSVLALCHASGQFQVYEAEYNHLYSVTEDKDGLESIRALHQQLDDDNDGTIEPSETVDFIRSDLQYKDGKDATAQRQKLFHNKDNEITVKDLWSIWRKSEVHNWTVDQTVDWLQNTVELPQYSEKFKSLEVTGSKLPQIASGSSYLTKVLGINNPIHRSKITLKATDVVLFGSPTKTAFTVKELILTLALALAIIGLFYALKLHKQSQHDIQKMMLDMRELSKAEETLKDLQEKFDLNEGDTQRRDSELTDKTSIHEVTRLKEEVEILRHELQRAEIELEDRAWFAPPVLQNWLQLTYEMEAQTYNAKKKAAGKELENLRLMCEKIKHKRVSLIGAFVSTHAGSIDEAERLIADSRSNFEKLAKEFTEMNLRWKSIESLCGCNIMQNPGLVTLQKMTIPFGQTHPSIPLGSAARSAQQRSISQDDLNSPDDNMDSVSVAASSSHMTSVSSSWAHNHQSRLKRGIGISMKHGGSGEVLKDTGMGDESPGHVHERHQHLEHFHSSSASTPGSHLYHLTNYPDSPSGSPLLTRANLDLHKQIISRGSHSGSSHSLTNENNSSIIPPKEISSSNGSLPSLFLNTTEADLKPTTGHLDPIRNSKSEDTASISSDVGSVGRDSLRKSKRKGFFSFARKKDKLIN